MLAYVQDSRLARALHKDERRAWHGCDTGVTCLELPQRFAMTMTSIPTQSMDPCTGAHLFGVSVLHVDAMGVNHTANRYSVLVGVCNSICLQRPRSTL